jgi:hypothetical protein
MTKEDDKYRQGRSKKQMRSSYISAGIAILGIIVISLVAFITN